MTARVLVVEDDPALLRGVADNFVLRGYVVETAADGDAAIEKALRIRPDLIVLDVMIPRVNGYEVCRFLRQENVRTPVVFLTAKAEEGDRLLGFGVGGDDYVAKPFSIRELLARAEAVLRRCAGPGNEASGGNPERDRFGGFFLDREAHKLRDGEGRPVKLSPREYALLAYFLEHRGVALSRETIMNDVWGYGSRVTLRSVDRFVAGLRRTIEAEPGEFIETIRQYGYRFRPSPGAW